MGAIGLALAAFAALGVATPGVKARSLAWTTIGSWQDACVQCTDPNNYERPQLAIAPNGAAVAAWDGQRGLYAAVRPSGGTWQSPIELDSRLGRPKLAINSHGLAVLVWAGQAAMESAFIHVGHGTWTAPELIPGPESAPMGLAIDAHGDVAMIWENFFKHNEDGGIVLASYRRAGVTRWPAPTALAGGPPSHHRHYEGVANEPKIALDAHGNATALWHEDRTAQGNSATLIETSTRPARTGGWTRAIVLARSSDFIDDTMLAVDARGDAAASWHTDGRSLLATTRPAGHPGWRAPVKLASSPLGFEDLGFGNTLAIDSAGEAFLAFHSYMGNGIEPVRFATASTSTGHWDKPILLGDGHDIAIACNGRGDVTVTWTSAIQAPSEPPLAERIMVAERPAHAAWRPVAQLSPNGHRDIEPNVGLDAKGNTTVIWLARGGNVEATDTP
ncbi:MAG TPA: hypothetical protein VGN08_08715 [Solirubrobacteraceae bacterium]|jgi:hypothetical protein